MASKKQTKTKSNKEESNENSEIKKLYRSREDKIVAGVCGGIAEYFMIDAVWVRLIAILLVLINGVGLFIYLIAVILIPENKHQKQTKNTFAENVFDKAKDKAESCKDRHDEKRANKKAAKEETIKKSVNKKSDLNVNQKDNTNKDCLPNGKHHSGSLMFGLLLILIGLIVLSKKIFPWLDMSYVFPIIIILIGFHIISHHKKCNKNPKRSENE